MNEMVPHLVATDIFMATLFDLISAFFRSFYCITMIEASNEAWLKKTIGQIDSKVKDKKQALTGNGKEMAIKWASFRVQWNFE